MSEPKNDPAHGRTWSTPQLTILVRVYDKESVLLTCKGDETSHLSTGEHDDVEGIMRLLKHLDHAIRS